MEERGRKGGNRRTEEGMEDAKKGRKMKKMKEEGKA